MQNNDAAPYGDKSDTPRTDNAVDFYNELGHRFVIAAHAERLERELNAARSATGDTKNAARYRWLRNQDERFWVRHISNDGLECDLFGHDLDVAIDTAMAATDSGRTDGRG